jgi:multidrug resistance efflux pump
METNIRETTTIESAPNNQYLIPVIAIVLIIIIAVFVALLSNGSNTPTNNGTTVDTDTTQTPVNTDNTSVPVSNPN